MVWTANRNAIFMGRLWSFAHDISRLRNEARQLKEIWFANGVSGDPDFISARGVEAQDATDTIVFAMQFLDFIENGTVNQADRATLLAKVLGGPVES